ncbi:SURF1 family protein [Pigmentiphaga humi]|uniref:SURF1-like protein n=1 Tax=Pigmentiphaga humi TaxID=2478468 RepID=A0A3P4B0H4_9BURK|nr:SURF1 family protein [Pigmentiphaga humi]
MRAVAGVNPPAAGPHRSGRVWVALALLAATVGVTGMLGRWQLHRAQEKLATLAELEAGRALPPLVLDAATPPAELRPWRPAMVRGRWLADRTVLLENRMSAGRPGFWVVTPLAVEQGAAVAVLRGWLPRPVPDGPVRVQTPPGPVEVSGVLLARVPRLLDLGALSGRPQAWPEPWPQADGAPPRMQNLDTGAYGQAAGLALLPAVLEQTGAQADGLLREWAGPPVNVDTHRGYALQWFSFAAIAAIAFGVLLVRHFRSTR